jgi:hypothetical protein
MTKRIDQYLAYRRKLITRALAVGYQPGDNESLSSALTDIRHLCDDRGINYAEIDGEAYRTYMRERAGAVE